jgi:hypothetical protein
MTTVCIAEDRQSEEIALRILILSLVKCCSGIRVVLTFPPATQNFINWISQFPGIELRTMPVSGFSGWNVKPQVLLSILETVDDEVWWIDSDVVLTCDFRSRFGKLPPETFVVCEEALYGKYEDDGKRAKAWGFEVGRLLPFTLNSGVIRSTRNHIPLLNQWKTLLDSEFYKQAQADDERPEYLHGDQDVLTALLSSQQFCQIPLKILHRGKDIIQYFGPAGYMPKERLLNLVFGLPPFIHYQGRNKPWRLKQAIERNSFTNLFESLYSELSPYNYVAYQYRNQICSSLEWNFLEYSSPLGNFFKILGLGNPALVGFPLSVAYSLLRFIKRIRRYSRIHQA